MSPGIIPCFRTSLRRLPALALALAAASPFAGAATLAHYTFDGGSALSSDTDPLSVAGSFAASTGALSVGTGTAFIASNVTGADLSAAIAGGNWFGFSITPEPGAVLDLASLAFSTRYSGNDPVAAVSASWVLRSSLDGFATNLSPIFTETYQVEQGGVVSTSRLVTLGDAFQSVGGTVEFRVYVYDNSGSSGRYVRIDNVVLTGTASAIPEPSAAAVLFGAVALCAGAAMRRGSRRARA